MKIGIIGAGQIGGALAGKLVKLGHAVLLANSRGPASLSETAAELGATAATVTDAARTVDLVVVTIPQKNVPQLPEGLFAGVPASVPVIDTGNYYPFRDGVIAPIVEGVTESRWVADVLGHPVIKVFNSIMTHSLATGGLPAGAPSRIALPVAGDEAEPKRIVLDLVDALGFDAIDAGTIDESWRQQPGTPVYCTDLDAAGVRSGLARADRTRAPELRDLGMQRLAALPPGATPRDILQLVRALQ